MKLFRNLLLLATLTTGAAHAQGLDIGPPTIKLVQNGATVTSPILGPKNITLDVYFTITGASGAVTFESKTWIANQVRIARLTAPGNGSWHSLVHFEVPLDGSIPYGVTLDNLHETNDATPNNNTFSSAYTPVAPTTALNWYDPRQLNGSLLWEANYTAANPMHFEIWFPAPISNSHQEILWVDQPLPSALVTTKPFGQPMWVVDLPQAPWYMSYRMDFGMLARNVRCNLELLDRVGWNDVVDVSADLALYLQSEAIVEVNSREVGALVEETLPPNYRTTMTPYQTAKALYREVIRRITYSNHGGYSAATVLASGLGDCGGFSVSFMAACRKVGIPARPAIGWCVGGGPHMWCEFWLGSRVGWVPVDASTSDGFDSTGTFAYCFGFVPYLNDRFAASWCCDRIFGNISVNFLQGVSPWVYGYQPGYSYSGHQSSSLRFY